MRLFLLEKLTRYRRPQLTLLFGRAIGGRPNTENVLWCAETDSWHRITACSLISGTDIHSQGLAEMGVAPDLNDRIVATNDKPGSFHAMLLAPGVRAMAAVVGGAGPALTTPEVGSFDGVPGLLWPGPSILRLIFALSDGEEPPRTDSILWRAGYDAPPIAIRITELVELALAPSSANSPGNWKTR